MLDVCSYVTNVFSFNDIIAYCSLSLINPTPNKGIIVFYFGSYFFIYGLLSFRYRDPITKQQ